MVARKTEEVANAEELAEQLLTLIEQLRPLVWRADELIALLNSFVGPQTYH